MINPAGLFALGSSNCGHEQNEVVFLRMADAGRRRLRTPQGQMLLGIIAMPYGHIGRGPAQA